MGVIIAPRPGTFPPPFPQQEVPFNTAGILIPGVEARIVREDGTDVEYGEPGELWVTGGNIALGYWENPRATAETFFEDAQGRRWLKTGDRFRVDKEGWFFFEDRIKVSSAPLCFHQRFLFDSRTRASGYSQSQWAAGLTRGDRSRAAGPSRPTHYRCDRSWRYTQGHRRTRRQSSEGVGCALSAWS